MVYFVTFQRRGYFGPPLLLCSAWTVTGWLVRDTLLCSPSLTPFSQVGCKAIDQLHCNREDKVHCQRTRKSIGSMARSQWQR